MSGPCEFNDVSFQVGQGRFLRREAVPRSRPQASAEYSPADRRSMPILEQATRERNWELSDPPAPAHDLERQRLARLVLQRNAVNSLFQAAKRKARAWPLPNDTGGGNETESARTRRHALGLVIKRQRYRPCISGPRGRGPRARIQTRPEAPHAMDRRSKCVDVRQGYPRGDTP